MSKRLGTRIRQARLDAGLTQEQLARKVRGASAADISKAERGEKDLTQEQLKQIAKATGVTQKSLLEVSGGSSGKTASTAAHTSMRVSATERRLVELYRAADSDAKKAALKVLRGEGAGAIVENLFENAFDALTGKK